MSIDVNDIIAGVQEYAKGNRYKVEIFPPNALINGTTEINYIGDAASLSSLVEDAGDYLTGKQGYGDLRTIALNCSQITQPGASYATKDVRTGSGPLHKMPYDKIFEPVTATFYNDAEQNGRRFFTDWFNYINKPTGSSNPNGNHFNYYEDYIGSLYIYQLDAVQAPSHLINLEEVYPSAIGEVALAYESGDQISTYTVTFQYRNWVQKSVNRAAARLLDNIR